MAVQIQSFKQVVPMIYAYNTPGIPYHEGWTKVGYTEKQKVEDRIRQQTHTANIRWQLAWQDNAMYKDGSGEYFTDHEFHDYLEREQIEREPKTEWFHADGDKLLSYFLKFAGKKPSANAEKCTYDLRREQNAAVEMTAAYFAGGGTEFLWNAKPRFGKTLSSYDLIRRMGLKKVLIVTNRPSIANSWAEDFYKFIGWRNELVFVSENDAVKDVKGVMSRKQYLDYIGSFAEGEEPGMVAFESLQGLKGSTYFGGNYNKLKWIKDNAFDMLIIDEAHEGVDTYKTDRAFENIKRKYTLHLSGTPFKALASAKFSKEQIYNWSYADEQEAKANWDKDDYNPYEQLPRLAMFTYQLSNMIYDKVSSGINLNDDESVDYAFDLNEFFATNENGKFVHEADIKKFLHALTTNEKYPYSTPELRDELRHTLWLLNRVPSAKALAKLLKDDPVFGEYEIVLAAGDGKLDDDDENAKAYNRVKDAIATHDKTITLSVGQLTVGVTVKEWSGVLMLCNLQSPAAYMQAAFRAQNPCIITKDGKRLRKETAYVFDFDPARTLIIFDEFANNLSPDTADDSGTSDDRKANIKRLLNFFPVLGEDDEGKMVELDAAQVLSIPRRLKSQEVVRRGFMSNFLFQNISNIFGAPAQVKEIIGKLTPAFEEPKKQKQNNLDKIDEIEVDENGEAKVDNQIIIGKAQGIFGEKRYEEITQSIAPEFEKFAETKDFDKVEQAIDVLKDTVKDKVIQEIVAPVADNYEMKPRAQARLEKKVEKEVEDNFRRLKDDYIQQVKIANTEFETEKANALTQEEVAAAEDKLKTSLDDALKTFTEVAKKAVEETIQNKPAEVIEQVEKHKAEEEKKTVEDEVRAHLRGFSRTIPSFIMAYGDENLTLQNFDDYTEEDVFEEVTGITIDNFRFLRDGGPYPNPDTGETEHFAGHLFDETVFNDSVQEFLKKKQELADYFNEANEEDIFDYIPPQKTNQIFTPRRVVKMMVDELEANNPGCFDSSTNTFADLYMKSGLYITEIVKRLFRSEKLKKQFPDDGERIRHILRKQVYGMAPTRIIYLIATNYILGFDEELKTETKNFVQADAAEAAKTDTLEELVKQYFG